MSATAVPTNNSPQRTQEKPKCGIIMPISEIDGLSESHWADVLTILSAAIDDAGFEPNLVSTTEEVGIIQKTIIENLYDNPIVVCDVSGKNPNVMFELGMRLAFDRATVIVKDDKTTYTFDTSPIQHLGYPRDLRFNRILDFKANLTKKLKNTHNKAVSDPEYTTFLKHFGEFKVAKIDKTEVSGQEYIIEELQSLRQTVARLEASTRRQTLGSRKPNLIYFVKKDFLDHNLPLTHFVVKTNDVSVKPGARNDEYVLEIPASSPSANELRRLIEEGTHVEAESAPSEAS